MALLGSSSPLTPRWMKLTFYLTHRIFLLSSSRFFIWLITS
uniref:Uncharacterized protein n=1 Tax=Arundo donax TaxID=35708 RepID=A0A0A9TMN5_ARUDO